ncbi:PREDICTED: uncharacterized protein LOC104608729 [Nelumbo nucifera]|uniref:Uncharacterized protein LOC104608729 n=1 Tax=Nelumbo nucifera TaxID=4432 RepID=A0A1U8B1N2_NELNU|nr:PREDICTED: uncharacterized protein LOC104608729 [Nelumbo nucifera]
MNGLASECSSGCESGWTMYLDHSLSADPCKRGCEFGDEIAFFGQDFMEKEAKEEDEEEDLSMVSDASSGPPHFQEDEVYCDENGCFCSASSDAALVKTSVKRRKIDQREQQQHQQQQQQQHPSFLDDTASSPLFDFSKNNFTLSDNQASMDNLCDFSQAFSATRFEGTPEFQKQFGFLQSSQVSSSENYFRKNGYLQRR